MEKLVEQITNKLHSERMPMSQFLFPISINYSKQVEITEWDGMKNTVAVLWDKDFKDLDLKYEDGIVHSVTPAYFFKELNPIEVGQTFMFDNLLWYIGNCRLVDYYDGNFYVEEHQWIDNNYVPCLKKWDHIDVSNITTLRYEHWKTVRCTVSVDEVVKLFMSKGVPFKDMRCMPSKFVAETRSIDNLVSLLKRYEIGEELADEIESEADRVLIFGGEPLWANINKLSDYGYSVGPGEKDSFGWLTALIYTKRGTIMFG